MKIGTLITIALEDDARILILMRIFVSDLRAHTEKRDRQTDGRTDGQDAYCGL